MKMVEMNKEKFCQILKLKKYGNQTKAEFLKNLKKDAKKSIYLTVRLISIMLLYFQI